MKQFLLTMALLGGAASAQTTPATPPATTTPATPAAPATPAPDAPAQDPATPVGKIGSEDVTLGEFERAFRLAAARVVNAQGIPFQDTFLTEFASARPEFLTQYLRDRAVYQLARVNTSADPAELDQQMESARADFASDEEFQTALAGTGYADADDLRTELERQAVVGAYLQTLKDRFKFGDAVVAGFYNLNKAKFAKPAEACVKHILVPTEAEAKTIVADLAAGADFAKVAADKSQDPGSAPQGGDLGCFGPGQMVESFDKASFTGPVGTVQTVQSQFGWHVLVVTKRTDAGVTPLEEAAPVIRDQLGNEAAQRYLDAQIAKLKTEAYPDVVRVAAAPDESAAPDAAPDAAPAPDAPAEPATPPSN
ncbi:peptidyl-prolyl cis-trans isomerase C [Deinococcus metalli]|uniref:Peptidyl-prolyl cis-trans isomerase C n=1 Tax=Deinococcus metalli TaxID=1141878 RepID=A0A7W8NQU4_9DEIO|nr:peptidylprolyl isomerase [Deinococcus metalli]MBB5378231.1 peptidyl-prolyl cis-trans isomerase C [Deinococcus metalli]